MCKVVWNVQIAREPFFFQVTFSTFPNISDCCAKCKIFSFFFEVPRVWGTNNYIGLMFSLEDKLPSWHVFTVIVFGVTCDSLLSCFKCKVLYTFFFKTRWRCNKAHICSKDDLLCVYANLTLYNKISPFKSNVIYRLHHKLRTSSNERWHSLKIHQKIKSGFCQVFWLWKSEGVNTEYCKAR